ncbi:hypothetical protein [Xenorhabdus ehlersii]|uniref:hypothetical protein n=1 Tax=Xenorhabdus ehlersii TaxID=290111 RepID=UPI00142D273B|nr:hypothetical protein [Xenorhabdus ehlersii]
MPPAPAERPPAAQASWATFARCREKSHKIRLFSPSQGKKGRYTAHRSKRKNRAKVHFGLLGSREWAERVKGVL